MAIASVYARRCDELRKRGKLLPALIYYHGGAFYMGSIVHLRRRRVRIVDMQTIRSSSSEDTRTEDVATASRTRRLVDQVR